MALSGKPSGVINCFIVAARAHDILTLRLGGHTTRGFPRMMTEVLAPATLFVSLLVCFDLLQLHSKCIRALACG